ncbi:beta-ketoacyl-[acyl-carrier-protein] synthase family protein [Aciditerrimonas ferrireducens]|uniref:Beta-ketoacyl-[acyl-carrier-protein] synthase family protein n=1 Tax=Aciditerrimonas ferrireducens TaxID=667306 RepID=A0ABV6C3W9_9ACTN
MGGRGPVSGAERAGPGAVVLTGLGALTPLGLDVASTWSGLLEGRSGVGPISAFDPTGLTTRIAAEVRGFDPASVLDPKRLRRTSRAAQLAVAAAREAVADAGLDLAAVDRERVGVVLNSAVAGFDTVERAVRQLLGAAEGRVGPYMVSSSITNMAACEVAIDLDLHGPVLASALACASGAYAFLEAARFLASGEADVVLCGGTDAGITRAMFEGLTVMGALSTRNDDPEGASRPFDVGRDGFVFGEGAVVAVLERLEHARARGAEPYCQVAGGALTADAFHPSAPEPSGRYAASAIERALQRSGVHPEELDLVVAHGTGTQANDRTEAQALHRALGEAAQQPLVSAPKGALGHLIGAAGALGVLVCALGIRQGVVPPTRNLEEPDPACLPLRHVAGQAKQARVRAAITNAFGFGGQNCTVVLRALP